MPALCCETCLNSFKQISVKFVAIYIAECCKFLHEYSILEPPGHVDCWYTQHFTVLPDKKSQGFRSGDLEY
jgi:hypothetical protein